MRIAPATPPYPEPVQQRLDAIMKGLPPLVLFRVMARNERLFQRFVGAALLDRGQLSMREREIVILRVCANHGAEYEWGVHVTAFADKAGLAPAELAATVHASSTAACWSPSEQLLIELCDQLRDQTRIDEPLWQRLRTQYSDEAILELLLLVGHYRTVSTLTNALELPLEEGAARFPPAS
jgi:alkylhydroperoxidase family enzyme